MRLILPLIAATAAAVIALPAGAATVKFDVALTAAAEVPAPGDADKGSGSATLTFDTGKGQVCYMLMAQGTDAPTMAHIHKGAAGVAGGVVVPLTAPANGMSEGCAPVPGDVLTAILASPKDYYVNIHTATYPKGAMRGQLVQ